MSNNACDTQFQGFARALFEELLDIEDAEDAEQHIARRVYVLVNNGLIALDLPEHMCDIPDMTELSKEVKDARTH